MDFVHPVRALIPGVQGRVLAVLAETRREELCRLVRHVATSGGMSPSERRRWIQEETGNDPGAQPSAP